MRPAGSASIARASIEQFCTACWRRIAFSQSRPFGCGGAAVRPDPGRAAQPNAPTRGSLIDKTNGLRSNCDPSCCQAAFWCSNGFVSSPSKANDVLRRRKEGAREWPAASLRPPRVNRPSTLSIGQSTLSSLGPWNGLATWRDFTHVMVAR
jgi:hypothetical protein